MTALALPAAPSRTEAANDRLSRYRTTVLQEVIEAVQRERVVVVGMAWNTHVRKARRHLDSWGIPYTYLGYGNYVWGWRNRLAIKLWSGWPTFPQVYVNGTLVGGCSDLEKAREDGTLERLLAKR